MDCELDSAEMKSGLEMAGVDCQDNPVVFLRFLPLLFGFCFARQVVKNVLVVRPESLVLGLQQESFSEIAQTLLQQPKLDHSNRNFLENLRAVLKPELS